MIKQGDVVEMKSDNREMTIDGIINKEEVECAWWNGKYIQFDTFSQSSLVNVEDCLNETFNIGDVVTLKSGGPRFVIEKIDGDEVFLNNISNTYNSWLFKKV